MSGDDGKWRAVLSARTGPGISGGRPQALAIEARRVETRAFGVAPCAARKRGLQRRNALLDVAKWLKNNNYDSNANRSYAPIAEKLRKSNYQPSKNGRITQHKHIFDN